MPTPTLLLSPDDDLVAALRDLCAGEAVAVGQTGGTVHLRDDVPAKHKFTRRDLEAGEAARMYGVTVGRAVTALPAGSRVTTGNLAHAVDALGAVDAQEGASANDDAAAPRAPRWSPPPLPAGTPRTFLGIPRADGRVGVANYWLVVPLVFCENRNVEVLREALEVQLGFRPRAAPRFRLDGLVAAHRAGAAPEALARTAIPGAGERSDTAPDPRVFPHVDGLRFLTHEAGCGGTRGDSALLLRLLAGYLTHPNVGGATVLSLGCQNAQVAGLLDALAARGHAATLTATAPGLRTGSVAGRPLVVAEQQGAVGVDGAAVGEGDFLRETLRHTFFGLTVADRARRVETDAAALCLGLECGGSDGFSGITANPLLGRVSDRLVGFGGRSILAEFPELHGVEAELLRRCATPAAAARFRALMAAYAAAARRVGSDFAENPSPGNLREGLVTDAMKSAGAARKGGTAPVAAVLDYGEPADGPGLHLLCTPGNDVESTTALAGSGAQLIAFTTGLGTPTGNPVAPTLKVASNTALARAQPGLIDFDAGRLVSADASPEALTEAFWRQLLDTASGRYTPRATRLGQFDFIPWRRDISL